MNSIYCIIQTAVTISNHLDKEIKEQIQSMLSEEKFRFHLSDGFNTKQFLETLSSKNGDEKEEYIWEEFSENLFDAIMTERTNSLTHIIVLITKKNII